MRQPIWTLCAAIATALAAPAYAAKNPALSLQECRTIIAQLTPEGPGYTRDPARAATIRSEWDPSLFSDPKSHDAAKYRYIVRVGSSERLTTNVASASLITQDFNGLYTFIAGSNWAYILSVPKENIIVTMGRDTGRHMYTQSGQYYDPKAIDALIRYYGVRTPEVVIRDSKIEAQMDEPGTSYNEVLYNPAGVKITGLVFFPQRKSASAGGIAQDEADAKAEAARLGVPLVTIRP